MNHDRQHFIERAILKMLPVGVIDLYQRNDIVSAAKGLADACWPEEVKKEDGDEAPCEGVNAAYQEGWSDALARALKIANEADPGDAMGIVAELKRVREASATPLCGERMIGDAGGGRFDVRCDLPAHEGGPHRWAKVGSPARGDAERVLEEAIAISCNRRSFEDRERLALLVEELAPVQKVLRLVAEVTRTDQDLSSRTMAELGAAFRAANEACK